MDKIPKRHIPIDPLVDDLSGECWAYDIRGDKYFFPKEWSHEKIADWLNQTMFRNCPFCNRVDVSRDHFLKCMGHIDRNRYE